MRSAELGGARAGAVAVASAIWLSPAYGQVINLGGRGWSAAVDGIVTPDRTTNQVEFDVRGGFVSDYVYRGTTLSDHKPAVGAGIEATSMPSLLSAPPSQGITAENSIAVSEHSEDRCWS